MQIPFAGGAYQARATEINAQEAINLMVVTDQQGGRSQAAMQGTPGLKKVVDLGTGDPVRGMIGVGGELFAVSDSRLFRVQGGTPQVLGADYTIHYDFFQIFDDGGNYAKGYIGPRGTGETLASTPVQVSAITLASPGVVQAHSHGLVSGQLIKFWNLHQMSGLSGQYAIVQNVSAHGFTIQDTTGLSAAETTGGSQVWPVIGIGGSGVAIYADSNLSTRGWNVGTSFNPNASTLSCRILGREDGNIYQVSHYMIEVVDENGLVIKGYLGSATLGGSTFGSAIGVQKVTANSYALVTVDVNHGIKTGDLVYFSSLGQMSQLNGTLNAVRAVVGNLVLLQTDTSAYVDDIGGGEVYRVVDIDVSYGYVYQDPHLVNRGWAFWESGFNQVSAYVTRINGASYTDSNAVVAVLTTSIALVAPSYILNSYTPGKPDHDLRLDLRDSQAAADLPNLPLAQYTGGATTLGIPSWSTYNARAKEYPVCMGTNPVEMVYNGNQLVCGDENDVQAYDFNLRKMVKTDIPPGSAMDTVDGYIIYLPPGGETFYITGLNDITVDESDFATAESLPDNLVTLKVANRYVYLLGEKSTEVWFNTGASGFPFERLTGSTSQYGCVAKYSAARADEMLFWLAQDENGSLMVVVGNPAQTVRISTDQVDWALSQYERVDDAEAMVYGREGHTFYCLTFPTAGVTWAYDLATKIWHKRSSGTDGGIWRATNHVFSNKRNLVGDRFTSLIGEISPTTYTEYDQTIRRVRTSQYMSQGQAWLTFWRLELLFSAGVGTVTGQGSDPQVMLQWSDDGGNTWSSEHWTSIGKLGQYGHRVLWDRLGGARQRVFRIVITDPVWVSIQDAFAEVELGTG